MEVFRQRKLILFLIISISFYSAWFLLYNFIIKDKTLIDEKIISNLVYLSSEILKLFGYDVFYSTKDIDFQMVGVDGSHPVWIGAPCNGLAVFALFIAFMIAFPGPKIHKLWFIPLGVFLLHILNVLRIVALTVINYYAPQFLDFNHNYTFTLLVYSCVFILWMIWVNKFSTKKTKDATFKK